MCGLLPVRWVCSAADCRKPWVSGDVPLADFKCTFCDSPDDECEGLPYLQGVETLAYRESLCDVCALKKFVHEQDAEAKARDYAKTRNQQALGWLLSAGMPGDGGKAVEAEKV